MPVDRHDEPWMDLHRMVANDRKATLLAEAEAERLVRRAPGEPRSGLRQSVGHALIRVGRSLADEPHTPRLHRTT